MHRDSSLPPGISLGKNGYLSVDLVLLSQAPINDVSNFLRNQPYKTGFTIRLSPNTLSSELLTELKAYIQKEPPKEAVFELARKGTDQSIFKELLNCSNIKSVHLDSAFEFIEPNYFITLLNFLQHTNVSDISINLPLLKTLTAQQSHEIFNAIKENMKIKSFRFYESPLFELSPTVEIFAAPPKVSHSRETEFIILQKEFPSLLSRKDLSLSVDDWIEASPYFINTMKRLSKEGSIIFLGTILNTKETAYTKYIWYQELIEYFDNQNWENLIQLRIKLQNRLPAKPASGPFLFTDYLPSELREELSKISTMAELNTTTIQKILIRKLFYLVSERPLPPLLQSKEKLNEIKNLILEAVRYDRSSLYKQNFELITMILGEPLFNFMETITAEKAATQSPK